MRIEAQYRSWAFPAMRWQAIDADTYAPCEDPDCACREEAGNEVGYGRTRQEAIDDLMVEKERQQSA